MNQSSAKRTSFFLIVLLLPGAVFGLLFPFLLSSLGFLPEEALRLPLFAVFFLAGFIIALLAGILSGKLFENRVSQLSERMHYAETHLNDLVSRRKDDKTPEPVFTADENTSDGIGRCGATYNSLLNTLTFALRIEEAIGSFTEVLSRKPETSFISEHTLNQFMALTRACAGAVVLSTRGELSVAASHGISSPETLRESDHVRRSIQLGERKLISIPDDVSVHGVIAEFTPKEVAIEPIMYKTEVIGAVILASATGFAVDSRKHLAPFMPVLGLALNNALAHDRLQTIAALDPLTGIYNRRFGLIRLHEEFGRTIRSGIPLGLVMMDLDHFKNINDTRGHLTGDIMLKRVVETVRAIIREGDVMLRLGGEEFLIILPASSIESTGHAAERIRRTVENIRIRTDGSEISVTVSLGATSFPEHDTESAMDLVNTVDKAMYKAKQTGRNRVVVEY